MGRLFWKFFFSYWAALLVAVMAVGAAAWAIQVAERGRDLSVEGGPRAAFIIGSAAATLTHGGPEALRALMADWAQSGDVLVFAVDAEGRDVAGRPVPPGALARAKEIVERGRPPEGARQVTIAGGGTYLLFVPAPEPSFLGRLLRPGPRSPILPIATGMLASLAFGAILAWYVTRPVRELRAAFERLSRGQLDTRIAPLMGRRRDEVADLGRDFDAMAQQLESLIAAQRSLLHDVSHELRSPLARLQAAIGLARQSPQKIGASLDRIEQEAQRVDELVAQLLTLSRLEANVSDPALARTERADLVDLVASVVEDADFEARADGKAVTLRADGEVAAHVRVELLHRAIENVIRNAVKYTAPGTTVEVTAGPDDDGRAFVVRVADRGPGVPVSELDAIFRPFYRSASGPSGPGFGLGLAIAKRALQAHGGTVRAANRADGGLLLELRLPLEKGSSSLLQVP